MTLSYIQLHLVVHLTNKLIYTKTDEPSLCAYTNCSVLKAKGMNEW